jgi:hypothetical protein
MSLRPDERRSRHGGSRARHAGGQPFPGDLVGQAVRLRGLPQAVNGAALRQVQGRRVLLQGLPGVLTTILLALSRPLAQETGICLCLFMNKTNPPPLSPLSLSLSHFSLSHPPFVSVLLMMNSLALSPFRKP